MNAENTIFSKNKPVAKLTLFVQLPKKAFTINHPALDL